LGISLILGQKISHTILGIIENRPDGRRFHFLLLTPHFKLLVENRPEIPESQVAQNHLHTVWLSEASQSWISASSKVRQATALQSYAFGELQYAGNYKLSKAAYSLPRQPKVCHTFGRSSR
jgi:hypothetical protein